MGEEQPTSEDIQELIDFLPKLYDSGFTAIERWGGGTKDEAGVTTMPWPEYNKAVLDFFHAASKECWSDRSYDPLTAGANLRDPAYVGSASLRQLQTLITFSVRGERFCDGFWASMIQEGHIKNILERLKVLRAAGVQP